MFLKSIVLTIILSFTSLLSAGTIIADGDSYSGENVVVSPTYIEIDGLRVYYSGGRLKTSGTFRSFRVTGMCPDGKCNNIYIKGTISSEGDVNIGTK